MKKNTLQIILFFLINSVGFGQIQVTNQDVSYKLNKASSDFVVGKILYESYKYTEPEKYKKDRVNAIEMITRSAESGYAPAQYYLGLIYLNDTLINDYNKGVKLLKKAAYQRNYEAIELLNILGEEYKVATNYEFWIKIFAISFLVLIYFMLAIIAHRRIAKSKLITHSNKKRLKKLTWLIPYLGALLGLLRHKKVVVPLDNESIDWINDSFNWIIEEFGKETLLNSEIIIPLKNKIPIRLDSSENCVKELIGFVASKMQINKNMIDVEFYNQSQIELDSNFITQHYEEDIYSSGQYWGKSKNSKYLIAIEKSQLNNPITLIATIAHELAHIKLLGEKRIKENDEYLTDLLPIIFGFGIFNANSIFQYQQDLHGWRTNSQGYLNERIYGFALAKFALYRSDFDPEWSKYLAATVKEEFEKSMIYIKENE